MPCGSSWLARVSEKPVHGRLARAVRGAFQAGKIGGTARDVDDPPGAARDHAWDDGPAAEVDAEDVDLEDPPPLSGFELPGGVFVNRDASVGDEHIDRPELGLGQLDHVLDGHAVGDVALDREPADLLRRLLDLGAASRRDGDTGARGCELERDVPPDSPSAACHECDLALKLTAHSAILRRVATVNP